MKVSLSITFDSNRDREILRRLAAELAGQRSAAIRQALREHYGQVMTMADLYREIIVAIQRAGAGMVARTDSAPATDEPPDLADALDNLGTS